MPLATTSLPTEMTIGIRDFNNEDSTTSIFFPAASELDTVNNQAAAMEVVIAGLTDGFIYGGGLSRRFNQTSDPGPDGAPATSNVQRKGVFIFENEFGTYNTYTVPSIARSLVLPGSIQINRAAAAVQAYVAIMTSAVAGIGGLRAIGGNGRNLVRLVDAYEDTFSKPQSKRR